MAQIPNTLFNAGINQSSSPWCPKDGNNVAAQLYGVRQWDNGCKWGQCQPSNTTPNFASLDNQIFTRAGGNNTQPGENIPIGSPCPGTPLGFIYTFGDTPQWASSGAIAANNCASPSTQYSCTKPASLNNDGTGTDVEYVTFAADVITRYKNYLGPRYYEIWNEADSPNFWCWNDATACGGSGSADSPILHPNVPSLNNLVRMAWDLKNIAHCIDPGAKILSPSFHVGTALTWFHNYNITSISAPAGVSGVNGVPVGCNWPAATVTGKHTYDYVNVHARGTGAAYPSAAGNWNPAAMITAYNNTVTECTNDSLPNCPGTIFNDEYGYNSSTEGGGNTDGYSAYVAQTSVFCAALGFAQCYWYQWDTASIGLSGSLQGTAWDTVAGWLEGATITSGPMLVGNLYEVGLTKGGITELIAWDTTKYSQPCCVAPANQTFGASFTNSIDLTGTSTPTGTGGVASVGWKPILLQQLPTGTGPDNIYCASGSPTWGATDGPATLPTVCFNTALVNTPATGSVVNVTANSASDLQAKLTAATCGQQITLPAGSVYSGNFTLPARVCPQNNYIWVVTSGVASLPSEGATYTTTYNSRTVTLPQFGPCYSGVTSLPGRPAFHCPSIPGTYTAKIVTPNTTPPLNFTAGTSSWRFIGLEITRSTGTGLVTPLVKIGSVGNIDHVIFDRSWIHGDENQDETETGLSFNAVSYLGVIDSYFSDFYCISVSGHCSDSHAIFGGTNQTNSTTETGIKLVNNVIEAAGENLFSGGGISNTTPSNFEWRLNFLLKPNVWNPSDPSYNGGVGGHPFIVKNCLEFKNAQMVLLEGNTCQNVWAQAQSGYGFLLNPTPQGTDCPGCFVTNVTHRYEVINDACAFMQITANGSGGVQLAAAAGNWSVHDLVADDLFASNLFQCSSSTAITILTEADAPTLAQALKNVSVNHNTIVQANGSPTPVTLLGMRGATVASGLNMSGITFTNNLAWSGTRGTSNQGGTSCAFGVTAGVNMINNCWSPYVFGGNCFVNNGSVVWPGSNVTSIPSFSAVFVSYNNGNAGNYTVASGACKGAATDGTDPGANIAAVASVLAGNPAPSPSSGTVNVTVTGSGTVTSSPGGISCPPTCSAVFPSGTSVNMIESPAMGFNFVGWGGVCSGSGSCGLTMGSSPVLVTATFAAPASSTLTVTITPSSGGTVTSSPAGISCPGICTASFTNGTSVTLSETPNSGFTFVNWSGVCSGATCNFTMGSSPVAATAAFSTPTPPSSLSVIISQGVILTPGVQLVNH